MSNNPVQPERQCGSCTKCCDGYLESTIYGHPMFRGRPCFFRGQGCCTIYNQRPHDPCATFSCSWLDDVQFPEWMKPELSQVIVVKRTFKGHDDLTHYEFVEAGRIMSAEVLNWIINWAINNKINVVYWIDGKAHRLGSTEFTNAVFPK